MRPRSPMSDNDPQRSDDPLSPNMAPTMRRNIDRDLTQPLDGQGFGTAEGGDWRTRQRDRLNRLGGAGSRVYNTNVRTFVEKTNTRQLLIIGGIIVLLILGILLYKNSHRAPGALSTGASQARPSAKATASARPLVAATAGAFGAPLPTAAGVAPNAFAGQASTQAFVVINTGNDGLKIRDKPSVNGRQIGTFPDTTRVNAVGEPEQQADGHSWVKVKGPQGEGWVAKEFLQPGQ
ncbi:MAG: hypothetical protein NVS4B8_18560 [Herpetosiphon sp.]